MNKLLRVGMIAFLLPIYSFAVDVGVGIKGKLVTFRLRYSDEKGIDSSIDEIISAMEEVGITEVEVEDVDSAGPITVCIDDN
jgi:hypothetical protein